MEYFFIYIKIYASLSMKELVRNIKINSGFAYIFHISLNFFFFTKISQCEKYITFLSKVRSSHHVMLSKIVIPLSTHCPARQTNF